MKELAERKVPYSKVDEMVNEENKNEEMCDINKDVT